MIDESLYPLEFARFRENFIQMRVDNTVANGGDGEAARIALNEAFDSGWRPPQQFEMWLRARKNLPLAKVVSLQTPYGLRWTHFEVNENEFRLSEDEASDLAFNAGYRFE